MTDTTFIVTLYGLPLLSLATLTAASVSAKRSGVIMAEWKTGLCGTAIIFGVLSSVASLYMAISATFRFGEALIPGAMILASLLCPAAIVMALEVRSKPAYLVIVAEVLQASLLVVIWGSTGALL